MSGVSFSDTVCCGVQLAAAGMCLPEVTKAICTNSNGQHAVWMNLVTHSVPQTPQMYPALLQNANAVCDGQHEEVAQVLAGPFRESPLIHSLLYRSPFQSNFPCMQ